MSADKLLQEWRHHRNQDALRAFVGIVVEKALRKADRKIAGDFIIWRRLAASKDCPAHARARARQKLVGIFVPLGQIGRPRSAGRNRASILVDHLIWQQMTSRKLHDWRLRQGTQEQCYVWLIEEIKRRGLEAGISMLSVGAIKMRHYRMTANKRGPAQLPADDYDPYVEETLPKKLEAKRQRAKPSRRR
jgi:hypothetical protein